MQRPAVSMHGEIEHPVPVVRPLLPPAHVVLQLFDRRDVTVDAPDGFQPLEQLKDGLDAPPSTQIPIPFALKAKTPLSALLAASTRVVPCCSDPIHTVQHVHALDVGHVSKFVPPHWHVVARPRGRHRPAPGDEPL